MVVSAAIAEELLALGEFLDPCDVIPASDSGIVSAITVRPEYDVVAYAREADKTVSSTDFSPTVPSRSGPVRTIAVPRAAPPNERLLALLSLEEPF